ncbi:MAG: HEAT repeat domain-containing protein [Armatimonadota bacterium]
MGTKIVNTYKNISDFQSNSTIVKEFDKRSNCVKNTIKESYKKRVNVLIKMLNFGVTRRNALDKLRDMGIEAEDAVPKLIEIAKNDNIKEIERMRAILGLCNKGPAAGKAIPHLCRILKTDQNQSIKRVVIIALGSLGHYNPELAIPAICSSEKILAPDITDVISDSLLRIESTIFYSVERRDSPKQLMAIAKNTNLNEVKRACAIYDLRYEGASVKSDIPDLCRILKTDKSLYVRRAALLTLGKVWKYKPDSAVPAIIWTFNKTDIPFITMPAFYYLNNMDKSAIPYLEEARTEATDECTLLILGTVIENIKSNKKSK